MDDALARAARGRGRRATAPAEPRVRGDDGPDDAGGRRDRSEPRHRPSPPPQAPRRPSRCRAKLWTTVARRAAGAAQSGHAPTGSRPIPPLWRTATDAAVRRRRRRGRSTTPSRGSSGSSASSSAASPMRPSTRSRSRCGAPEQRGRGLRAPHRARSAPARRAASARRAAEPPMAFRASAPTLVARSLGAAGVDVSPITLVRSAGRASRAERSRGRRSRTTSSTAARGRADGAATSRTSRSCSPAPGAEIGPFVRARAHARASRASPRTAAMPTRRGRSLAAQLLGRPAPAASRGDRVRGGVRGRAADQRGRAARAPATPLADAARRIRCTGRCAPHRPHAECRCRSLAGIATAAAPACPRDHDSDSVRPARVMPT